MSQHINPESFFIRILKSLLSIPSILFFLLLILSFQPGKRTYENNVIYLAVAIVIWISYSYQNIRYQEKIHVKDITTGVYLFLILWEASTRVFDLLSSVLFPSPEEVFHVFYTERVLMVTGLFSSLYILLIGFAIALVFGNLLGLFVGWNTRLKNSFYPVAKVFSPIPPMIYTPYLIALLPTFSMASISVIGLGLFWPTFMNMINRVGSMDRRIIDSANSMGVSTPIMLLKVILPYSIPGIVGGLRVQLSTTFMVLVMAEMIGAQSGLGFFVKKYSDYADYTRVMAGIIFIGIVITLLNQLLSVIENKTIRWKTL